jgi:signal transduction histidine kinase
MQEIEHRVALERLSHQNELEQQKIKTHAILEERNRIAKELHDDLGSLSSSIHIMSGLIEKNLRTDSYESEIAQKIKRNSAQLSETLSDLVWAVYSKNDSFDNLIERMKNYAYEMLQYKDIQVQFKHDYRLSGLSAGIVLRKNLFLLFKEAINNVAKYSKASLVKIELKILDQELLLSITDNGVGFDNGMNKLGNGMANMRSRAHAVSGALNIVSAYNEGTSIELRCRF